jgi:dihydrofolate reductase
MQVVLIAAVSADGKIAEAQDQISLDWTSKEDLRFFIEKTKEIGVVIMGRKTFDTFRKPLKDRQLIVMTRSPEAQTVMEGVEFTSESPQDILERLGGLGIKRVVLAGGSSIYSKFLYDDLVSDIYLTVEPLLFGKGVPLAFGFDRIEMKLEDVTRLGENGVLLHYTI